MLYLILFEVIVIFRRMKSEASPRLILVEFICRDLALLILYLVASISIMHIYKCLNTYDFFHQTRWIVKAVLSIFRNKSKFFCWTP